MAWKKGGRGEGVQARTRGGDEWRDQCLPHTEHRNRAFYAGATRKTRTLLRRSDRDLEVDGLDLLDLTGRNGHRVPAASKLSFGKRNSPRLFFSTSLMIGRKLRDCSTSGYSSCEQFGLEQRITGGVELRLACDVVARSLAAKRGAPHSLTGRFCPRS